METNHEVEVTDLDAAQRRAVEDIIGARLEHDQRVVISVAAPASPRPFQSLADWAAVYDGLTEEQIEFVDRPINTRANLSRNLL
jgi:hypothetical protein